MDITDLFGDGRDCCKIGSIVLNHNYPKKKANLNFEINPDIDKHLLDKNETRIYFIVINGEVCKIGGSSSNGGIKSTMSFYTGGNCGSPSIARFGINYIMYEELLNGSNVDIYCTWADKVSYKVNIAGIIQHTFINVDHKIVEAMWVDRYKELCGYYPIFNLQEAGVAWPEDIKAKHNELKNRRKVEL